MSANTEFDSQQIELQKLTLLFRQSRASAIFNVVLAAILAFILSGQLAGNTALIWLLAMLGVAFLRVVLSWAFLKRAIAFEQLHSWQAYYFTSLLLIAAIWGLGGAFMLSQVGELYQAIIFFFLMGMGGGFLVAHSVNRFHIITFMPLLLAPASLYAIVSGSWVIQLVGITNLIFMLAGTNATRILVKTLDQNFTLTKALHDAKLAAEKLANIDALTNLNNRRAFIELSKQQLTLCRRRQLPVTFIMADVDDFKAINDNYGHDVGDKALIYIANLIDNSRRESDICARLGGEEFVILLSDSALDDARQYAERLRKKIEDNPLILGGSQLHLSVSMGIASNNYDIEVLMRNADKAMYQAKRQGKNQVVELTA